MHTKQYESSNSTQPNIATGNTNTILQVTTKVIIQLITGSRGDSKPESRVATTPYSRMPKSQNGIMKSSKGKVESPSKIPATISKLQIQRRRLILSP